jgi:hypothetical protein
MVMTLDTKIVSIKLLKEGRNKKDIPPPPPRHQKLIK